VRQDNDLVNAVDQSSHLLNAGQRSMLVEARHWVVDDDDLVSKLRVAVERRKEKGKRQRVPVTGAQVFLKAGPPPVPAVTATDTLLMTTL
jgi:hypothetical protein